MIKKFNRALHGPSWVEVIFGAVLSLALGGVVGAALLVFQPVVAVKELPAETERNPRATYFVEGSRDSVKGKAATAKRKAFAEGQSVTVTEDELNILAGPAVSFVPPPAPKVKTNAQTPESPPPPAPVAKKGTSEAPTESFKVSTPNFRVADNALQMGVQVTVDALGLGSKVIVQSRGNFVKRGETFAYEVSEVFVGACPIHRLPYVFDYVREKIDSQTIPDDIAASWKKLASVSIEGNALKLAMP